MIRSLLLITLAYILDRLPGGDRLVRAPRPITYILSGRIPVPCPDLVRWGQWMATQNRIVAHSEVDAHVISTQFTGHDLNLFGGPPLLFETVILDDTGLLSQRRTSSWTAAKLAHAEVVADLEVWGTKILHPSYGDRA